MTLFQLFLLLALAPLALALWLTAAQRYLTYAQLARRWGIKQPRTVAKIVRQYKKTAIAEFTPNLHRVALRDVLAIERELRGCGSRDVEGI